MNLFGRLFSRPRISIVVIMFDMQREAQRTLYSMSSRYQIDADENDYEVVVVDNGSSAPLEDSFVRGFGKNFRYYFYPTASSSPVAAVNFGVSRSSGSHVGIFIDGARILSPGIVKYTLAAVKAFDNPVISTLGWHLGPEMQNYSIQKGYNQTVEDQLLAKINWPNDGYRLFEISALAGSSSRGWFMPLAESNGLFVSRKLFDKLGGMDERFDLPGGGLVNLDFYRRAVSPVDSELVVLLGEGSFHQIHGGIMTNIPIEKNVQRFGEFEAQYRALRGEHFQPPDKSAIYIGAMPPQALASVASSASLALEWSTPPKP